jgi:Carboxypeptidase regulatory-like domain
MQSRRSFARLALLLTGLFFLCRPLGAQDFRGTILGTVSDSTGAAVPGVTVTIQNLETKIAQNVVSDGKGQYQVRYLNSGTYSVTAQLTGFKTFVRPGIEVRVGDSLRVDVSIEPGGASDFIEVKAVTPVLETGAVTGTTIDSNQIRELPLGDGTAYMLTRMAPGVTDQAGVDYRTGSRPMDNGNMSAITVNGTTGGNDFLLDGAPNRVSPGGLTPVTVPNAYGGNIGFSPPSESISEFKVQTNAFDAQAGQTAGGVVNLALKSGTNSVQGSVGYFNRDASRTATPEGFAASQGLAKPPRTYNRYNATLRGPIIKDKTFFMASFEHLRDVAADPSLYTVPTARMRTGDLSEWLGNGNVQVFDPFTATGTTLQRTAFPGNVIPANRINAIAQQYISYYPEPNRPGLEDNYSTNLLRPYDYNAGLVRIDHNLNSSDKLFLTAYWNKRREDRYNWALGAANATGEGVINGFAPTRGYDFRGNLGGILGYTSALSSTLLLDVRGGFSRFSEYRQNADSIDPASLGFSSQTVSLMQGYQYLPLIAFGGFSSSAFDSRIAQLGSQRSDFREGFTRPFYNVSFAPTLTRIWGSHTLRLGYDLRYRRWDVTDPGFEGGRFLFDGTYTKANSAATANVLAQSWAQFLLGLPTVTATTPFLAGSGAAAASQFDVVAAPATYSQTSHGVFLQDEWRVNRKLTVNLGFRLEVEQALREANNRNLGGFDTSVASPVDAAAKAAYGRSPIAEVPVGDFDANGVVTFEDGALYNTGIKPLPRVALSYMFGEKTVLRVGGGLFSYPYYFDAGNQAGFSQPTPVSVTANSGATFVSSASFTDGRSFLANPIPGTLIQPVGSGNGASTSLGLGLGTIVPFERKNPYYGRWQAEVQRDLTGGWSVSLMYVGSQGWNLPVQRNINAISTQYLTTARARDLTAQTNLNTNVTNPFAGLLPGSTINAATVQKRQLLRPYPQFLDITSEEYVGSDRYNAGTLRVEKRFSNGNSLLVSYTRSKLTDKLNFLNAGDATPEDRLSPSDRPHRIALAASARAPFGRGQKWGKDWNPIVDAFLGGWQLTGTYEYSTGVPLVWGNLYYDAAKNPLELKTNVGAKCAGGSGTAGLDCPAWDLSGFYFPDLATPALQRADPRIALADNVRYFPSTLPNARQAALNMLAVGLYKNFTLSHKMSLQVRAEAINALNYSLIWAPGVAANNANFGLVTSDRNLPRDVQLGARLSF